MGLATKLFGTYSEKQLKKIRGIVDAIEALSEKYKNMTNEQLSATTGLLKERLAAGETLDDILPDAFAAIREADDRILGKRPFRVQLIGGIVLHQGRISEMKTGEGKTLVATMPAYLNALTGRGVHVVTVNEYLARRDSEEMGRVFDFMGLKTGLVAHCQSNAEKKAAYGADITYGTNNEFGFDYLRDNMALYRENIVQRGHVFAIVDEVDSILIDEARTPLIISGAGDKATDIYDRADAFVRTLKKLVIKEADNKEEVDGIDADYIVDEKHKTTTLTPRGTKKAEAFFGLETFEDEQASALTTPENAQLAHHINQALHAHGAMQRDVDYVVNEQGVMIVDAFTGRIMPGRRYSNGLHQAIEAKEHVKVEKENKTLASITFQNYFRLYEKLSGMTGTALTEEAEFNEIYGLDVIEIPTNRPMVRIDHEDSVYKSINGKYNAIVKQVIACHEKKQPVLVGTVSIEKSEELSAKLKKHNIPHVVLNAKYHEKEADIVAGAGKLGAVTISTNMAGRGTDIMLGGNPEYMAKVQMRKMGFEEDLIAVATGTAEIDDEDVRNARKTFRELYEKYKEEIAPEAEAVRAAGGLFILGTERHESRRIDNQLRGRAGRQGDPGESRFFLSFEDDLMRLFGGERILGIVNRLGIEEDMCIDARIVSNSIENAQKQIEANNFKRRKNVLTYDDVMNQQRTVIYKQRREVLDGEDISPKIRNMIVASISMAVERFTAGEESSTWDLDGLREKYKGLLTTADDFVYADGEQAPTDRTELRDLLCDRAMELYESKFELFGEFDFHDIERTILLRTVDENWMEHLDVMDDLKSSIGLHSYAQRNPAIEYRIQGSDIFDAMVDDIRETTVLRVLTAMPRVTQIKRTAVATPVTEGFEGSVVKRTIVKTEKEVVDRNGLCPCGSGRKYKKCCGAKSNEN